ncbi:MAG: GspH/FimT family pseudopilin [Nitrosomonadales bacterium]|nr:GspH/FimT family pseudopilin [Nitrosomonadales bacterium]
MLDHEKRRYVLSAFPTAKPLGFTLIEVMIAIAIIAIAMVLGIPSYRVWVQNTQIRNAAESIQNGLQRARAEAVSRNTNVAFVFGAGSSWTVSVVNSGEVVESRSSKEGSTNVSVATAPAGSTTFTFNNFGARAANADGSAAPTQINLDSTLLSAADSRDLRVTLGIGGQTRMCDPNLVPGSSPRAC